MAVLTAQIQIMSVSNMQHPRRDLRKPQCWSGG